MMNSLFSRHIAIVGLFLILFAGVTVECVNAQPTPKPTPTAEELLQQAHQNTFDKFKDLQAAAAAKEKADCEGTPEDKKKAGKVYSEALDSFYGAADREAQQTETVRKAFDEWMKMRDNEKAAQKDPSTTDAYKKEAKHQEEKAGDKYWNARINEQARILREYADDLKKLAKCPPTEHGKSTDGKKRRKKDDSKQETTGDSPPGISFDIGIGGGRGREREHRRDRKKDERRRDDGGRGGFGISPGITFGR